MTELTTALQYILTHDENSFNPDDFIQVVEIDAKKVLKQTIEQYEEDEDSDPDFAKLLKHPANEKIFLLYFMLGFHQANTLTRSVSEMRSQLHSMMAQFRNHGKNGPDSN